MPDSADAVAPDPHLLKGQMSTSINLLDIIDGSLWVCGGLVLGCVSDKSLVVGEGDI